MKRALAMLLALILCVGCAPAGMRAGEPSQLIGRPFSARMLLEWNGKEYSGSIARDAQGGLSLALTGESLILPVSFACGTGACAVTQGELSLNLRETDLPSSSLPSSLQRAFVLLENAKTRVGEDEIFLEAGAVRLICDSESLAFSDLALEGGRIEFTEFAFTDP